MSCRICGAADPHTPRASAKGFPENFLSCWTDPFGGGQIEFCEAVLLYLAVRLYTPRLVVEVGTCNGDGTTFYAASALRDNEAGVMHTIEISKGKTEEARDRYAARPGLRSLLTFHCGPALDVLPTIEGDIDMLIIDGGAGQALAEVQLMEPRMAAGSVVAIHDWCTEKVENARQYLEASPRWKPTNLVGLPARGPQYRNGKVHEYTGIGILERL